MASKFINIVLLVLLVLPALLTFSGNGGGSVLAQGGDRMEDIIDGEEADIEDENDGDSTVESEDTIDMSGSEAATAADSEKDEEEEEEKPLKPSPDGDTYILFTKPSVSSDLPAGEMVKFLVGFTNKGDKEFLIETMDASFRYPQDYSFFIQNFTAVRYDRPVEPNRQASFEYAFTPSETFNARPFGLVITLSYKDSEGVLYQDAVFNETINIVEPDEGLDGETFFLYVFLAAVVVLLLVGAHQLLSSFGKKRSTKPRQPIEMGTQNKGDIDYDWLPKETLSGMNKSPRRSPKQSPGRRRTKRTSGATDD